MKVYYAHPISTYGTQSERRDLSRIKKAYPKADIINPGDPDVQEDYEGWLAENAEANPMHFFKNIVRQANIVVYTGKTPGVKYEIKKAKEAGIPVIELTGEKLLNVIGESKMNDNPWFVIVRDNHNRRSIDSKWNRRKDAQRRADKLNEEEIDSSWEKRASITDNVELVRELGFDPENVEYAYYGRPKSITGHYVSSKTGSLHGNPTIIRPFGQMDEGSNKVKDNKLIRESILNE